MAGFRISHQQDHASAVKTSANISMNFTTRPIFTAWNLKRSSFDSLAVPASIRPWYNEITLKNNLFQYGLMMCRGRGGWLMACIYYFSMHANPFPLFCIHLSPCYARVVLEYHNDVSLVFSAMQSRVCFCPWHAAWTSDWIRVDWVWRHPEEERRGCTWRLPPDIQQDWWGCWSSMQTASCFFTLIPHVSFMLCAAAWSDYFSADMLCTLLIEVSMHNEYTLKFINPPMQGSPPSRSKHSFHPSTSEQYSFSAAASCGPVRAASTWREWSACLITWIGAYSLN